MHMNAHTTTIMPVTGEGFIGWYIILVILAITVAAHVAVQMREDKWETESFAGYLALIGTVVTIVGIFITATLYLGHLEAERDRHIIEALDTDGYEAVEVDSHTYILIDDGDSALYTVRGEGDTLTFYQITE